MVAELIQKQKVKGSVEEWLPGVAEELESVVSERMEEVSPEVAAEVLRGDLAMRLRMLLEAKSDGRMKGRLIGQGFWEGEEVTGVHVDSPVASFAAVRMLLFMNGKEGDVIASGDVSKAFLKADEYPEGSEPRYVTYRMYKGGPVKVWRLKGPLYGSRDSPLKWYESFQRFMLLVQTVISEQIGFELDETVHGDSDLGEVLDAVCNSYVQGIDEPCVFVNRATGVRMVVFVDDLITRGSRQRTEELYTAIQSKYPMRSWNVLTPENPLIHLGFEITEEVRDGELYRHMSQQREVEEFMREHGIEVHSEVSCPMPDKWHLGRNEELLDAEGKAVFKSMMGSFGWWSISLRYDIAQSVSRLQSKTESPTVSSLDAAYRLAAYIASTASFKLGGKVRAGQKDVIVCHSDSDYAGDPVLGTRSQSGVIILMNGIVIHWRSKKQPKTVFSPAAAEIYAASEAVRELRWVHMIARDLQLDVGGECIVQVDNNQVLSFKYGTCVKSRLRGMISNRWNWVMDLKDEGVDLTWVASKYNMADILTKCLANKEFNRQIEQIRSKGNS